jgi:hypothetical protein
VQANVPSVWMVRICAPLLICGVALAQQLSPDLREVPLPEGIVVSSGKEDPEAIQEWDAIWAEVFVKTMVAEDGSPGSGVSVLMYKFGLDDRTASTLFRHVQSSFETRRRAASAARDSLCDSREQIVTKEDLVLGVGKIRKASDDARAEAVAQVEGIVGADAYKRIIEASNQFRSSILTFDVDLPTLLSHEPPSAVAERTERLCNPVAGRPLPAL